MKLTQGQLVIRQLKTNGEVTRNWALQNFISRLGAICCNLQKDGWVLNGHYRKTEHGKDFVYELVSEKPLNKYQLFHQKMQNA